MAPTVSRTGCAQSYPRGIEIDDENWLNEVADLIRQGVPVIVSASEESDPHSDQPPGRHRASK